jgi:hypothetical protein
MARKNGQLLQLGYLRSDIAALKPNLAGPERQKLDAHLEALALIEKRVNTATTITCTKPPAPDKAADATLMAKNKGMLEIVAQVFACNLTRVAALRLELMGEAPKYVDIGGASDGHDCAHHYRPADQQSARNLSRWHRWTATEVAYLLDMLKAIPEGGKTVYDNTVLLWSNELGDPAQHVSYGIPHVVAGGGGTYPRGRYLVFENGGYRGKPNPNTWLLTSIANQFGANLPSFGDPDFPGGLPGFLS